MAESSLVTTRPIIQVIDKDLNFCHELRSKCKEIGFEDRGLNYFVVAVLGCQSTGKSTLLNLLFGTQFEVMDQSKGRNQTTLGVWMGFSGTEKQSVLVFDVEGTDSKERGEEHGIFERKTSLFSLALSEVLLLNLWTTDVGRFEGANYGLLKTVFDLNLQLFTKQTGGHARDLASTNVNRPKTLLLFILRDHDPETPLDALANTLRTDMGKLWADIKKPAKFATSSVHDFFDFEFTSLPHFKWAKAQWTSEVELLRDRFINPENERYVFKPQYKVDVPADGFPTYAESIWDTIQAEKDLDLPSQRHMLAVFRCDEISKEAFSITSELQQSLSNKISNSSEIVEDFGESSKEAITRAVEWFNSKSSRYEDAVVSQRRDELREKLISAFKSLFRSQLQLILTASKRQLFQLIEKEFGDKKNPRLDFPTVSKAIQDAILSFFTDRAEESIVFSGEDTWTYKAEKDDLVLEIEKELSKARESQLKLFMDQKKTEFAFALQNSLSSPLEEGHEDMWKEVRKHYNDAKELFDKDVENVLRVFKCSEEEVANNLKFLADLEFTALRSILEEKTRDIQMILNDHFKKSFELQDNVPRKWGKGDEEEVKKLFKMAALESEKLLDVYSVIRLDDSLPEHIFFKPESDGVVPIRNMSFNESDADSSKLVLITARDGRRVLSQFRDHAQSLYRLAMQDVERATSTGAIPMYVLVLGLVLGANEIWWVLTTGLTNPFFLFFLMLCGGGAFAVWKFNLMPVILAVAAPIQTLGTTQSSVVASAKIRNQSLDGKEKEKSKVSADGDGEARSPITEQ